MKKSHDQSLSWKVYPSFGLLFCLILIGFLAACAAPHPTATLLLKNLTIYTDADSPPFQGDILISDKAILDVRPEIEAPAGCRVITLTGMTAYPGWVDAHAHLSSLGKSLSELNLTGLTSCNALVEKTRDYAKGNPSAPWITGRGWDQNIWSPARYPTNEKLSRAIPDRPVYLRRVDGHAALVNGKALKMAGITAATPDPPGGEIVRDAKGNPSGVLVDNAVDLVGKLVPAPSVPRIMEYLRRAMDYCASLGLTSVHDAGVDANTFHAYRLLEKRGEMKLFVNIMLSDDDAWLARWWKKSPLLTSWLRVQTVKLYADGALGSRGAWLYEPYKDRPGHTGLNVTPLDHLRRVCREAYTHHFQVAVHAIGDRAVGEMARIYEKTAGNDLPLLRWRIEHLQVFRPDVLPILVKGKIIASMQPYHYLSDRAWAVDRIGDRMQWAYAWDTMLKRHIPLCFGSDFPIESPDPFQEYGAALEGPHRVTPRHSLSACTLDAQWAAFQEGRRGKIARDYYADLTILNGDVVADPSLLPSCKRVMTVVNGKITYGETP